MQQSDHFDGKHFFNPSGEGPRGFREVLKWQREGGKKPWPKREPLRPSKILSPQPASDETIVTFIGHSTFLIQTPFGNLLTDPIFSDRASPVSFAGPKRYQAPGIAFENLPNIDLVLISHDHYDHMDVPALRKLEQKFHPTFVTSLGNQAFLQRKGLRAVHEFDWWDEFSFNDFHITTTPAQHFSARTPFDRNRSLWSSFVIETPDRKILFAADSAYAKHFKEIYTRFGPMDLALIPIGAYEPRWFMGSVHMDPEQGVQAHLDLHSRLSVGMHYGTFNLANDGMNQPIEELREARHRLQVSEESFRILDFGQSLSVPASVIETVEVSR